MLDWDERYSGRNPDVAEIDEKIPPDSGSVTLLNKDSSELTLPALMRRSLRDSLMQEIGGGVKLSHPRQNTLSIRVDHTPEFWRARFQRYSFRKILLESQLSQDLPEGFAGEHRFEFSDREKKLKRIEEKTYRLVVSTPKEEQIFHLAPSVDLRNFLAAKFDLRFDENEQVVRVGEDEQTVVHAEGLDYHVKTHLWRSVGMPLNLRTSPRVGETYALVFATVDEFRKAAMNSARVRYPEKLKRQIHYGHEASVVVFLPRVLRARWKDLYDTLPIRIGNGDRERTCEFTTRQLLGYQSYRLRNEDEILRYVTFTGAQDVRVEWVETGDEGVAVKLKMQTLSGEVDASLAQETLTTGLIQSGCLDRKPLKIEQRSLWDGAQGYFSWLLES
jgi:hypothetical protein